MEPDHPGRDEDNRACIFKMLGTCCHCCYRYKANQHRIQCKDYKRAAIFGKTCGVLAIVWVIFSIILSLTAISTLDLMTHIGISAMIFCAGLVFFSWGYAISCSRKPRPQPPTERVFMARFPPRSASCSITRQNPAVLPVALRPQQNLPSTSRLPIAPNVSSSGCLPERRPITLPQAGYDDKPCTSRSLSPTQQQTENFRIQQRFVANHPAESMVLEVISEQPKTSQISFEKETPHYYFKEKTKSL